MKIGRDHAEDDGPGRYTVEVAEVMTTGVRTVGPEASYQDVVECLLEHDISGVPVVDADGTLLGMITEADLISKEAYAAKPRRHLSMLHAHLRGGSHDWVEKAAARTARDLMSTDVDTVSPHTNIGVAAKLILEKQHKRLAVCQDGKLVGIVSRHDLIKPFGRSDDDIAEEIAGILDSPFRSPEEHRVQVRIHDGVATLTGSTQWPEDLPVLCRIVARVPGVVAVDSEVTARSASPLHNRAPRRYP